MINNQLVDRLKTHGELSIGGQCKDCIYGKHTAHLFNHEGVREKELLERIHIDLWGPAQIALAGGSRYFMLMVDGFSSYRTVAFTNSKSADVILNIFKAYQVEAERQTGKRIKHIRLDMGKEWLNNTWENYRLSQGLDFEFTTPYAHQQNSMAERSIRTILDGTWTTLAESGLLLRYWADAVQTTVYVRNLIPSS